MARSRYSSLVLMPALIAAPALKAADILTVAGRGEMAVEKKWNAAEANQKALERAETLALEDALAQALYSVYGNRAKLGADHDRVLREVVNHKATLVLGSDVRASNVDNGKAMVELAVKVDGKAFRAFLENSLNLSLAQEAEGKFKVVVLSYTVEGQDANRAKPVVLREEVTDNRTDVQSASFAARSASGSASSSQSSVQAAASASSKGNAAYQGSARLDASRDRVSDRGASSAQLSASRDVAASKEWDNRAAASLDARSSKASSSYQQSAASGSAFSDRSSQYHRVTIYADPTKKGAGATNEVRAALGEVLEKSGLNTRFVDMDLMGRTFETEDDLYLTIRENLKKNPDIAPGDYVAVALNRVTPVNTTHRYTSQVVYRVIRIKDGDTLLPDKVVTGDSGDQVSDDLGRASATKLAIRKADSVLPEELRAALRKTTRAEARSSAAAATTYVIRVDNIKSPAATAALKQALRNAGFTVTPQFRGEAKSETIQVALNGKSGSDVMALIEPHLGAYDVDTMDERATVLKGK
ncbi:MAG: hypothetical protein HY014_10495 [Acidobacteria bacterium]|nr:hypothetical protein [Acidobacteriota bacterium]MBI3488582.1 hypothetical protein [Acidobacteriota bacterium]